MLLGSNSYRPEGVEIVVLHPMEAILLKLRIGINLGIMLSAIVLMCDLTWNGKRIVAESRRSGSGERGNFGGVLLVLIMAILMGALGAAYSHEVLVPLLLDYLSDDAASAGLETRAGRRAKTAQPAAIARRRRLCPRSAQSARTASPDPPPPRHAIRARMVTGGGCEGRRSARGIKGFYAH